VQLRSYWEGRENIVGIEKQLNRKELISILNLMININRLYCKEKVKGRGARENLSMRIFGIEN